MAFDRGGDQHIGFLGDPGIAVFDQVACFFSRFLVYGAVLVHDGQEVAGIHSVLVTVGVRLLVMPVPARDTGNLAAQLLDKTDGRILRHVAKAFDRCNSLRRIHVEVIQGFAHRVDHAVACGFGAAFGAAAAQGLAGENARGVLADEAGILVHHPAHHLGGGPNVRRGHVVARTDVLPHSLHPAAADLFLFIGGQRRWVADHAALAAAERDVGHGAFPGHPRGEGTDRVEGLGRVEADAAFVGAARIVVLDAESLEDADRAVIHANRDTEGILAHGKAQHFAHAWIQLELFRDAIELFLRHFKGIDLS